MSAAVLPCQQPPDDPCTKLGQEINDFINRNKKLFGNSGTHGLKYRFQEQIEGANGPPGSGVGDPEVWNTHDKAIREQQVGLKRRLDKFDKNNCGDKVPIPSDALNWATRPAPQPSEWTGPAPAPAAKSVAQDPDFMKKMSEITGLTGVALIVYLIISEGSRLFPPRNLVPVP
jgi:hypothetical protein